MVKMTSTFMTACQFWLMSLSGDTLVLPRTPNRIYEWLLCWWLHWSSPSCGQDLILKDNKRFQRLKFKVFPMKSLQKIHESAHISIILFFNMILTATINLSTHLLLSIWIFPLHLEEILVCTQVSRYLSSSSE